MSQLPDCRNIPTVRLLYAVHMPHYELLDWLPDYPSATVLGFRRSNPSMWLKMVSPDFLGPGDLHEQLFQWFGNQQKHF